jgi:hypothetical protein
MSDKMKTLHYTIIAFLLAMIFLPDNVVFAQNQTQPTIEFDQASYGTPNMSCNFYNTGKISAQDQEHSKATITVTDSNANKFSTSIDKIIVFVWSDSDKKGVEITAYETSVNSGIFKGTVTISEGQSTQDIIHVSDGDTLSAKYAITTPGSFDTVNHDITTTSFIGMTCPPLERVPASSLRILDGKGNPHHVATVGQQVLITSDITNPTIANQNFTYIVQIQDKNGSTASLAWLSGTMLPNQTSSPSVSWTPGKAGNYIVNIFVWQSLTNPNALSPPLSADLTVLHDLTAYQKSSINNAENLHCELGFELMTKPTDGSPVCVTPSTAQKLAQRGWAKEISQTSLHIASTVPPAPCDIAYPLSNMGVAVLYMPVNSTGKICATYHNPDSPVQSSVQVFAAKDIQQMASEITTSAYPDIVPTGNSTIVYDVKTGSQAGLYGMSFFCNSIPFAVGYDNQSRIILDDFPWLYKNDICLSQTNVFQITGLSGIDVKYVTEAHRGESQ